MPREAPSPDCRAGRVPYVSHMNNINPCVGLCAPVVAARVSVYLEAWVGYEPGVITQVGSVVLDHTLCFWLTEVLIRGGETASCQHHSRGLWKKERERGHSQR